MSLIIETVQEIHGKILARLAPLQVRRYVDVPASNEMLANSTATDEAMSMLAPGHFQLR